MKSISKSAVIGFLFGTVGIFALSFLSLISQVFEVAFSPLFWPGRTIAAMFVGSSANDTQVLLLTLCNGVIYAILFVVIALIWKRIKRKSA